MFRRIACVAIVGAVWVLAGCSSSPSYPMVQQAEPPASDIAAATVDSPATAGQGMGMGMGMGMGGSMRAAHHATIPAAYAGLSNPVPADVASLERGGEIFSTNCAVCHGDGGMGDGPGAINLDPPPAAVAHTSQMMGEAYLFWRISEGGRGDPIVSAMPSWKVALDEQARWDVINYVQALGQGTVQPRRAQGGAAIDPDYEQRHRAQMLATAIESGVVDQAGADTFQAVHGALDALMVETGLRMQGSNLTALLSILVERGTVSAAQADQFTVVHDRLIEAGLMQ